MQQRIRRYWDQRSAVYRWHASTLFTRRRQIYQMLIHDCGLQPGNIVLDLGCGPGFFSNILKGADIRLLGIDLSTKMIRVAKRRFGDKHMFVASDAMRIPLKDCAVHGIVCRHLVWTIPDEESLVREVHRVLKPGGFVFLIDGCSPGENLQETRLATILTSIWDTVVFTIGHGRNKKRLREENRLIEKGLGNLKTSKAPLVIHRLKSMGFTIPCFQDHAERLVLFPWASLKRWTMYLVVARKPAVSD